MADLNILIESFALQNALHFNGKANPGNVIGKVIGADPSLKEKLKDVAKLTQQVVASVNKLSLEQQEQRLREIAPDLLEKKVAKERDIFAFFGIKEGEKVVTAFPPEPSKYPHIGHAKAILLNYELARRHHGTFILRFEDTNPELAKQEFYDIHLDNYRWLGIQPDKVIYVSDFMPSFYEYAEQLITSGNAYLCQCAGEQIKEGRMKGTPCVCRSQSVAQNLKLWKAMPTMEEGTIIVRLKIDLQHQNSTMRDPTIMRIIDHPHPRTGTKYRLWPNYDFENSVMDGKYGITHRLRSKEFELRNELQTYIQNLLGFTPATIAEFGRFNMTGVESSGRIIREKVNSGELLGWDDPSLTTLVALRRRGFLPEAIKSFVLSTGISKAEATMTWDDLIVHNKRLLDKTVNRYFFVEDPVEVSIHGAHRLHAKLKLHQDFPERGFREYPVADTVFLARHDVENCHVGELYRLIDCQNILRTKQGFQFHSTSYDDFRNNGKTMLHWISAAIPALMVEVMMPSKEIKRGMGEAALTQLKIGDTIQFQRFGFCKLDSIQNTTYRFWYTHD
ncbi:glutamate--tRNA ligase [Candidatus Woesearchaeota archaeon]|nr:glutamate--tRNA ligase [Candidatus Woesearchaeota archaeon]